MGKQVSQSSLRSLALAPMAGFRTKTVTVPEWENARVKLREPSAQAWLEWQQVLNPKQGEGEPEELTAAERALRNKSADVVLLSMCSLKKTVHRSLPKKIKRRLNSSTARCMPAFLSRRWT